MCPGLIEARLGRAQTSRPYKRSIIRGMCPGLIEAERLFNPMTLH